MYLMYVDESGDTGLKNSPGKFFVLSAIVVHESRWRDFMDRLVAFKKSMRGIHKLPVRAEIHASEYISKRPVDLPRHIRLAILRNSLDELAKMEFISITNIVVKKLGKPANYDAFDAAWRILFQRFENTLKAGNFPGGHRNDHGLIFTDSTASKKLVQIVRRMSVFNYIPHDGWFGQGARNVPIKRVIEDSHPKDSVSSLPIQMCDVAAYFLYQRYAPNKYIKRQSATHYFDRLLPVLNTQASRGNNLGIVEL